MADVQLKEVDKIYDGGRPRRPGPLDLRQGRRVPRARRPVGVRQDDRAAHGRRPRGDHGRDDLGSATGSSTTCRRRIATSRWCSRTTRSTRTCRSRTTSRSACGSARCRRPSSNGAHRLGGEAARPDAVPRAQAARALRRPAPARRDGSRDRARAAGLPHGRAAVEPRREAARPDARRDREAPARARDDDDLRHARPGRGDDDGRPRRGHEHGRAPAGRPAAAALRRAREPVRGQVHRNAADEPVRGDRPHRRAETCP